MTAAALHTRQLTPLDRERSRIAELENIIAAMRECHDERVSELLAANTSEVERRREMTHERDAWRATAEALAKSLIAAQAERDTYRKALEQAAREIGEESMALEEGTEAK